MKIKQEDGTEIEVLTPEEAQAQAEAAVEEYKKANPPVEEKPAEVTPPKVEGGDDPVAALTKTVEGLQTQLQQERLGKFAHTYAGADAEKQNAYKTAFTRLTGYEETPEGQQQRAADAARLAFGSDQPVVDVANLAPTQTGGPSGDKKPAQTEADATIQKALGITPEMVKTFGPGGEKNPGTGAAPAAN